MMRTAPPGAVLDHPRARACALSSIFVFSIVVVVTVPQLHGVRRHIRSHRLPDGASDEAGGPPVNAAEYPRVVNLGERGRDVSPELAELAAVGDGGRLVEPVQVLLQLPEFGLAVPFAPVDFTQVNHAVNEILVRRALALLQVGPQERALDLFCGLGNFTLPMARRAARVIGIEGNAQQVQRATQAALANGLGS